MKHIGSGAAAPFIRLFTVYICATIVAHQPSASAAISDPQPPPLELHQSIGRFSLSLFTALHPPAHTDCIISPFSVLADLAMTWYGARHQTAAELQSVLQLGGRTRNQFGADMRQLLQPLQSNTSVLRIANRIYVQQSQRIRAPFNRRIERDFFARAQSLNFGQSAAAADTINRFVANATRAVIRQLIDASSLSASTQMVLINAVYFRGAWLHPFRKRNTRRESFYVNGDADGESVAVEFMHQTEHLLYADLPELNAVIVGLPYEQDDYRMHVLLPNAANAGGGGGLAQLTATVGAGGWDLSAFRSRMDWSRINLSIPKFQTRYRASLNAELQKMGIVSAFSSSADFSDMLEGSDGVQITDVVHEAFIQVDETGTEAAAATAVIMSRMAAIVEDEQIVQINRPFLYYIEDRQSNVFFVGQYTGQSK